MKTKGNLVNQLKKEMEEEIIRNPRSGPRSISYVPNGTSFNSNPNIYGLTDPVLGGVTGAANIPIKNALDNCQYLYNNLSNTNSLLGVDGVKLLPEANKDLNTLTFTCKFLISPNIIGLINAPEITSDSIIDVEAAITGDIFQRVFFNKNEVAGTFTLRIYNHTTSTWGSWEPCASEQFVKEYVYYSESKRRPSYNVCEDTTEGIKIVDLEFSFDIVTASSFDLDTDGTFYYTNQNDLNRIYKKKYNEIGVGTPTTNVGGFCPRIIGNYLFFTDISTLFLKRKDKNTIDDGVFFTNDFGANPVMIDSEYVAYVGAPGTDVVGARTRKKPILSDATYAPIGICINRTNYLTGIKYISTATLAFQNLTVPGKNIHFVRTDMSSFQTSAVYSLLAGIDVQNGFDFFGDYFIFSDNSSEGPNTWMLNLRTYADFPFKKKICTGFYPRIISENEMIYQKEDGIYLKNIFIKK